MTTPTRARRTEPLRAQRNPSPSVSQLPTPPSPVDQWTPPPPVWQTDVDVQSPDNKNKVTAAKWVAGGIAVILAIGVLASGPDVISSADDDRSVPEGIVVGDQRFADQAICGRIEDLFEDEDVAGVISYANAIDVASPRIEQALDDVADALLEFMAGSTPSSSELDSIGTEMVDACSASGYL